MNARDAVTVVRRMLQQGHDIAPETWRSDPIFRYATIGLGITAGLLLLRLFGPDVPELHAPPRVLPFDRPSVPNSGASASLSKTSEPEVPKIAPGQSLDAVTVVPAVNGDRFGTFKPGTSP